MDKPIELTASEANILRAIILAGGARAIATLLVDGKALDSLHLKKLLVYRMNMQFHQVTELGRTALALYEAKEKENANL